MPIYEYECERCGTKFELLVFEGETVFCPHCGWNTVRKILSVCAAHFKGSGFYVNDYKKTGNDRDGNMPAYKGEACRPL